MRSELPPPSFPTTPPPNDHGLTINTSSNGNTVKINDMELTMENGMLPMLGIFCTSVILLVATVNNKGGMTNSMQAYSNTIAAISMILSFVLLIRIKVIEPLSMFIRYFQFVWSFVGGCILTFGTGPFSRTGNGYFCLWAMVIFSFLSIGGSYETLKGAVQENASPLVGLGFCSFLVTLSALPYLSTQFTWECLFAVSVSLLTISFVAYSLIKFQKNAKLPNQAFQILVVLSMLWIFVAGVTTFRGPFLVTGNGYFSSWGGCIFSVIACREAHQKDDTFDDGIDPGGEAPPSPVLAGPGPPGSPGSPEIPTEVAFD